MKKVITNNIKSIIAGSIIASSLIGLNACGESNKAEDLGNGDDVRESVDENGNAIKNADDVSKDVEGKIVLENSLQKSSPSVPLQRRRKMWRSK